MIARHWLLAGTLALSLHAGFAAWVLADTPPDDPEIEASGSAMPIDLTALTAAAPEEVATRIGDVSPEVAQRDAARAEQQAEPPPAAEKIDLAEQTSPEESEVLLPKPAVEQKDDKPEVVEEERKPTPPQQQQEAVAAQEAAAPSPSVAPPAPNALSLQQGITPSQRRSKATWEKTLVTHLDKHKRYPVEARNARVTGEAVVEFVMDRAGAVVSRRLVQTSGSPELDAEAIGLLARAAPLPLPPVDVRGETFNLVVPVRFNLR